jgi:hypothetical protein
VAENPIPNSKPFVKGDPRINRGGRPKSFDAARALVLQLGNEVLEGKDGAKFTRFQLIIRDWLASGNFQKQKAALELAFGKVPDKTELTGILNLIIDWDASDNDQS